MRGIERCDSVTVDPHKWLAMPFAAGAVLTSHPEALARAFSVATPYMPQDAGAVLPDNSRISMQWSRRMNSLKLWLTLRVHGRRAYEAHIERQLELARSFAQWVEQSQAFELTFGPVLPIVNFRAKSRAGGRALSEEEIAAHNQAVVEAVTRDGRRWISTTLVNGRSVMRMMVISYLTEERHLAELEDALTAAAARAA